MQCRLGCIGWFKKFFDSKRETVFAHIFPVSNENENERAPWGEPVSLDYFSVPSKTVFTHISPIFERKRK
jgi:hypothetical protein